MHLMIASRSSCILSPLTYSGDTQGDGIVGILQAISPSTSKSLSAAEPFAIWQSLPMTVLTTYAQTLSRDISYNACTSRKQRLSNSMAASRSAGGKPA